MAVLNVLSNGNAPAHAQIGDVIRTAGGNYRVVAPNTKGATYNPSSGFWSVKDDTPDYMVDAKNIVEGNQQTMTNAAETANQISARSSAQQYAFNAEEAQKNRDWQERMSNTSHQREVQDLIAAGLNPVLSSSLGGASTPSGATASGSSFTGQKSDVDTALTGVIVSMLPAILSSSTQKDIARIQAETALQTAKISSAASMYSAEQSAAASRYGSDRSYSAQKYVSDNALLSSSPLRQNLNKLINEFLTPNSAQDSSEPNIFKDVLDLGNYLYKGLREFIFPPSSY